MGKIKRSLETEEPLDSSLARKFDQLYFETMLMSLFGAH